MKKDKIEQQKIKKKFPKFGQRGSDTSDLNMKYMRSIAKKSKQLTEEELSRILDKHKDFVNSGGIGGFWQTMNVNSLIIGIYAGSKNAKGSQAIINYRRIECINWKGRNLQWANLIGIYGENIDFTGVDFSNSLITDSCLINCNFKAANLQNVDFSRSLLRNTNFQEANLEGTDFENCDLTEADFRRAKINDRSSFLGSILENINF